jgi:hypothetical protein
MDELAGDLEQHALHEPDEAQRERALDSAASARERAAAARNRAEGARQRLRDEGIDPG